ncbi:hypothetical protein BVC80_417g60 [Macleaya cordata]|uniref:RNase H type-1 domain-containing protein n=1 Tax=Macleaya cordata TaxID=56857 RepID=A0A200R8Z0_MACCD|nr:hypothetical protein BVC80_417g60 [Macleaya cordata]
MLFKQVLKWIRDINLLLKVKNHSPRTLGTILLTCRLASILVRKKHILLLRWSRPPLGYFILNTDGASLPQGAVGGGVIRNDNGDLVATFHSFYEIGTNNLAEIHALLDGLSLSLSPT